ncbi:DNA-binding NarL/FixJ family response regulator [Paenochrobactrum gallinarii]|uniref:Flagellar transcriptional regulator FtcR n=1 Tax=Paenochrobactrum gallinarii TaxID=643673 RepID=A0A841LQZ4_9HYPH|nr:response regulator transcription factor [Paenochrobactrum gallinarii]MBB6260515.1 DNA-binding NarL/FixJ family response regulator [Paenochrobactrum gallinarii]
MHLKFIIADDHPLFRGALRQVLEAVSAEVSITEVGDFESVVQLIKDQDDLDLLLLDLTMPGGTGLSGLIALKALQPALPIIIVSGTDDNATISRALELGASGFIPKSTSMDGIGDAVRAVLDGDIWVPAGVEITAEPDAETRDLLQRIRTLTPQQMRVLTMLGEGLLNKQIAFELSVSEATVKAHVSAVLQKLNVDSRTQAVIVLSKIGAESLRS